MKVKAGQRNARVRGGAHAFFASRIWILFLTVMLSPAFAAAPAASSAAKGGTRLASLQVEIWPEYDRPAALVIMRGELAADVTLPAKVSLRIAASSGGPSAVAYSNGKGGNLLNLQYDQKITTGGFITLLFDTPERFFHIEFYDPLNTKVPDRSYAYVWPGDIATDRLNLIVQEPATASNISVQPNLATSAAGQEGLRYRSADIGPYPAGKRLELKIAYTKTDSRTSMEIVKPAAPVSSPMPAGGQVTSSATGAVPDKMELAMWLLAILAALGLCIWAALTWWYGRGNAIADASPSPAGAKSKGFCTKCGAPLAPSDRFCSKCGTRRA